MQAQIPPLSLGFSPCPNDTFIFHALVHNLLAACRARFASPILADVETLNLWAMQGRLDVSKVSFHAFGHLTGEYVLLGGGAALGRGCGPLLVAAKPLQCSDLGRITVAIPGEYTTAAMLLRLFAPHCTRTVIMPFHRIMPAMVAGEVDGGVIIHESRFTYPDYGLHLVRDLGAWWESETGHPIPLGGIVARRRLGGKLLREIDECVRHSVRQAFANPLASGPYVKTHAQELAEAVREQHIKLYVNRFSEDLGEVGLAAVREFLARGVGAGLFPAVRDDFFVSTV